MRREIKSSTQPKKGQQKRILYQEDIHQFDSLITTLRLAVTNIPNINNKKFVKVVRECINNNTYGTSEEVLNTLVVLYKSKDPLKVFAKLSESALAPSATDNHIDMDI